jgi:leucyl/phenylalanyl-tRNA--protein transferase
MFTRRELGGENASKLCLLELDRRLSAGGFVLLDSQEANPHMAQFGGGEMPFDEYQERLALALEIEARW